MSIPRSVNPCTSEQSDSASAGPLDSPTEAARRTLVDDHVRLMRTSLPTAMAATLVASGILWFHSNRVAVASVTIFILVFAAISMAMLRRINDSATNESAESWLIVMQIMGGLSWGSLFLVAMPYSADAQLLAAMMIQIGMAANAMESVSSERTFYAFHIPFSALSLVAIGLRADQLPPIAIFAIAISTIYFAVLARARAHTALDHATLAVQNKSLTSELQALNQDLAHRSTHDTLTGLPNRLAIERSLDKAMTEADLRPVAILFVDLDGFKDINDTMGHNVGDDLLVTVARRYAKVVPDHALLGRLGGDEMIVILQNDGHLDAIHNIADRLIESLAAPIAIADTTKQIGASIGVAKTSATCRTARDLLRTADIALYQAKALGGNQWVDFTPEMTHKPVPSEVPRLAARRVRSST